MLQVTFEIKSTWNWIKRSRFFSPIFFSSRFASSSMKPFIFSKQCCNRKALCGTPMNAGVAFHLQRGIAFIGSLPARTFSGHARNKMLFHWECMRLPIRKLARHTQNHHCYPRFICIRFHAPFFPGSSRSQLDRCADRCADLDLRRHACFLSTFIGNDSYGLSFFFEIVGKRNRVMII